jgi:hypothetical protein
MKGAAAIASAEDGFWSPLRSLFLRDGMQPGAVLFLHLFCRNNFAAKVCELHKLALDCL